MLKLLNETPSTQTVVKEGNYQDREGVYTFNQTDGVGRLGTKWDTTKEESICFSFRLDIKSNFPISIIIGTALAKHLDNKYIEIKWPNDLYIHDKKFCGILVEKSDNLYTVGIGINTKSDRFGHINIEMDKLVSLVQDFVKQDFSTFDVKTFERLNLFNRYNVKIDNKEYVYDSLDVDGSLNLRHNDEMLNLTDKKKIEKSLIKKEV